MDAKADRRSTIRGEAALAAASAGAVGGLAALGVWELTTAPAILAGAVGAAAGTGVHVMGTWTDRALGYPQRTASRGSDTS